MTTQFRVGHGFDVHPWSDDASRVLVLGGVEFPELTGLAGHSDADAIAHACTDALLSAAGLGDIGSWFPDTDAQYEGANSIDLLAKAAGAVAEAGWQIANVDITVICDEPKIGPHREKMQQILSEAAGGAVTVKGKRTEGLQGLAGGVQCAAIALLVKN